MNTKYKMYLKRKERSRSKIRSKSSRPRMSIFRSNKYIYLQLIDDLSGNTIASASTLEKSVREICGNNTCSIFAADVLGAIFAERVIKSNLDQVVFDKSGYKYHGIVKALADSARKKGLKF